MNVQTVHLDHSQVSLDIEIDSAAVGNAIDRAYQRLSQRVNVPGFRKGKAPRAVLEAAIGRSAVMDEALDIAINDAYQWALKQTNIEPITSPEIDLQGNNLDPSQPLFFTAKFYVQPTVELGDYRSIRVTPPKTEVTDEEVENAILRMADNQAVWEPVEEQPAQEGDVAVLKVKGTVDGETAIERDEIEQLLGSGNAAPTMPDLTAQVVGLTVGEGRDFELTLPDDFQPEQFAGKTMQGHVELLRLERKVTPTLDDAFAQSLGEFDSMEALRERARTNLTAQHRLDDADAFVAEVTRQVVDSATVDIPPPMIEDEVHRTLDNLKAEVESRRYLTFDLYLRIINKTMEQLHEEAHEPAERRVKSNLVLEAIADAEGLTPPREQVDAELRELSALPTVRERDRRRILTSPTVRARVEARLKRRLALEHLLQIANPTDNLADTSSDEGDTDQRALQEVAQSHIDALENPIHHSGEEEL